jgi:Ser/Thr protein kinase RdoA (MazF antagonist)
VGEPDVDAARTVVARLWFDGPVHVDVIRTTNNQVFAIEGARERFVLRGHRTGYRSQRQIESEAEFVHQWSVHSRSRLSPVRHREGGWVAGSDGMLWTMLTWVDGASVQPGCGAGAVELRRVGESLARLHEFSGGFQPSPGFDRPRWRLADDPGMWHGGEILDGGERAAVVAAIDTLTRALEASTESEPVRLIHGDPVLLNWLHHDESITLIDFDDLGWGWRVMDVGAVLENLEDAADEATLRDAFLDGYESVLSLPITSRTERNAAVLLRHVTSLSWALAGFTDGKLSADLTERLRHYRLDAIRSHIA